MPNGNLKHANPSLLVTARAAQNSQLAFTQQATYYFPYGNAFYHSALGASQRTGGRLSDHRQQQRLDAEKYATIRSALTTASRAPADSYRAGQLPYSPTGRGRGTSEMERTGSTTSQRLSAHRRRRVASNRFSVDANTNQAHLYFDGRQVALYSLTGLEPTYGAPVNLRTHRTCT